MKCKYYNVCPSCRGWCNNREPNGDCIEFILSAYETKSKIIDDIIEASYNGENVFINDYATHLCDINFTLVNKLTDLEDAERVLYKLNSKLFTYNNELEELNNKINDVQELIKSQELMIEQLKGDENE